MRQRSCQVLLLSLVHVFIPVFFQLMFFTVCLVDVPFPLLKVLITVLSMKQQERNEVTPVCQADAQTHKQPRADERAEKSGAARSRAEQSKTELLLYISNFYTAFPKPNHIEAH